MKQNKILQENLKILKQINPELVKWIKEKKHIDWLQEIKSQNGDDNLIIQSGSQTYPAYCMKNPAKEAQKAAKKMDLYKEDISIFMGIGLGYLTNEVLPRMEKGHRLIVIEPVAKILELALSKFDFTEYLKSNVLLLVTPGGDDIQTKLAFALQFLSSQSVVSAWPFTIENYTRKRVDEYSTLTKLTSDILNQILTLIITIILTPIVIVGEIFVMFSALILLLLVWNMIGFLLACEIVGTFEVP